jgi:hypothetical protein
MPFRKYYDTTMKKNMTYLKVKIRVMQCNTTPKRGKEEKEE